MGLDLETILKSLTSMPQTQKDIQTLAKTAQTAQSPEVMAALQKAELAMTSYAISNLVLSAISTAALLGMFLLELRRQK